MLLLSGRIAQADIANELACEKVYVLGCDKAGRPLVLICAKKHNGWTRRLDELERFCCYLLDNAVRCLTIVLCSKGGRAIG